MIVIAAEVQARQNNQEETTVVLTAMYSSDINYYGQATSEKFPYFLSNVTVNIPFGLYISAGSYKLLNYGSNISEADLSAGFDYDFNKKLSAGIAYTRSFYPENSPLLQASNENNLNASATYKWPSLKSMFSADFAFGKEQDLFLSLNNSKEIELGDAFKGSLSTEPSFEMVAGTRHYTRSYIVRKNNRNGGPGYGYGHQTGSNQGPFTQVYEPSTSFDMLSYNFKIPLSFSRAGYIAELGYQFSILGQDAGPEIRRSQSYFSLAFYYQF